MSNSLQFTYSQNGSSQIDTSADTTCQSPSQTQELAYEPLLAENPNRFVILPIKYSDIWKMYKQ